MFEQAQRKVNIEAAVLTAAMLIFFSAVGTWVYAYRFNRRVESLLEKSAPRKPEIDSDSDPASETDTAHPETSGKAPSKSNLPAELADLIGSKGLFGKAPPVQAKLGAILGDQALINNQWMKVGDDRGGVKLIGIGADSVKVEIEGKPRDVQLWQPMPGAMSPGGNRHAQPGVGAPPASKNQGPRSGRDRRFGGRRGGFRGRGEFFRNMSPEMREKLQGLRERMRNGEIGADEMRQEARKMMEQNGN